MKVLWLFPPSQIEGEVPLVSQNRWFKYLPYRCNFIYPIIAAYGITMIKNAGYDIEFLDAPAENKKLIDVFKRVEKADLVIMEGRTAIMPWIWQLAEMFKKINKSLKVAVYGDHVICRPQESLDTGIDYVINCGDYGFGAFNLVRTLEEGMIAPRIFPSGMMENLDDMPFVDRDLVPWQNYFESWRHREEFGWYESGRGCPYMCTFCSFAHVLYRNKIRVFGVKRIVEELEYATKKYGIKEYLDDSDTFLTIWGYNFAAELEERGLDIFWNVQTRADQVLIGSVDVWKQMKKSGLHVVKLGVDGGSDYTLSRINKGYDVANVKKAMEILKKAGLETHVNMIIGWPWETKKQAYDVIKWVKKLKPNQAQFSLIQPFIGTPIYDEAVKNGWFDIDPNDYSSWNMKRPILKGEMTPKEIAKLHKDAWKSFYMNPRFVAGQLGKSIKLAFTEQSLNSFKHLWRGFKGVYYGHMRAVEEG